MKQFPFLLVFLSALNVQHATAAKEQPLSSRISQAKVFLAGAQITRTASTAIKPGSSILVFTGLSQDVDPQSIQVSAKGGFAILSVNHRMNYLEESPKKKEIEELLERIKKLEHDWAVENGVQQVWVIEEQLLLKNNSVGGQQSGLTAAQLQAVNDYVRERMKAMKLGWLAQEEKKRAINEEADRLRQQLAQLQAQAPRPTSEVVVEIDATAEASASFTLSYFVRSAGWVPAYDLRAKSVGQPIELLMKAQVMNNSGEDWDKVELALSSGNPTLGGVMPQIGPWVIQDVISYRNQTMKARRSRVAFGGSDDMPKAAPSTAEGWSRADKHLEEVAATSTMANTVINNATTFEFAITTPFSVPADGMAHTVGVKSHSIAAEYKHYCTPKLDKDAFLYARTTGWEDLNLLPGQANVFFEGTFVGRSFLELDIPRDTLDISLGRDKGVVVERVKRKGSSDKPVIGGKRTVTIGWDLNVRNNKSTAISIEVRDQYPISPRSEVEVKLIDKGGAVVDEAKGLLTWALDLQPKATQKLAFTYQVKHPKDEPVVLE